MEKRRFPGINAEVSLLGFGLMRLPRKYPDRPESQDIDYDLALAMVDEAMRAGVNYYDTAWPYHEGLSETFAGEALSRYPRHSYYLATKCPTWEISSADDAHRIFEEQLKKCRVEYFDFYLVHSLTEDFYRIAQRFDLPALLREKKEQGLIRNLGFSFHDHPELLRRIVTDNPWDFAQIQLNYLDWDDLDAKRLYAILEERGIPAVIMEPVRGGALATLTPEAAGILKETDPAASTASWALRYAATLPGVLTVLSGMSNMEQVRDNIKTMSPFQPLSTAEYGAVERAAAAYRSAGAIPCTGCRYCMDCPAGVDIPRVFSVYNLYRTMKGDPLATLIFNNNYRSLDESARAHNCVACGDCLEHCPQNIAIPERMEEIAAFAAKAMGPADMPSSKS